ncbi:MAG: hypothetical protein L3J89_04295 [Gammaproteobacteria bacterium]|nr:hypothetical protein [Gammaproteobacteria bacterium]
MRAFVLMVLALNVAFFAWQFLVKDEVEPAVSEEVLTPSAGVSGAATLALVSEVSSIAIDVIPVQPVALVEAPVVVPDPDPVDLTDAAIPSVTNAEVDEELVAPALVALCYKAGPFKQRAQPQELVVMAEQYGFDVAVTAREVESLLGEWIYLTEYASVKSARDDVTALKAQGIVDVAVTRLENGQLIISLGIFGQKETRKRRLRELRALGYVNYQTKKRYRKKEEFWLVLSGFEGEQQRIMADELGVTLSDRFPTAQLMPVGCIKL